MSKQIHSTKERSFHQLTDKVSLFFSFSSFSPSPLPPPPSSSPLGPGGSERRAQFADSGDIYMGKRGAVSLLLPPLQPLAPPACEFHTCIPRATASTCMAQGGAPRAEPMIPSSTTWYRGAEGGSPPRGQRAEEDGGTRGVGAHHPPLPHAPRGRRPCRAAPASAPPASCPGCRGASAARGERRPITLVRGTVFLLENDALLEIKLCSPC